MESALISFSSDFPFAAPVRVYGFYVYLWYTIIWMNDLAIENFTK